MTFYGIALASALALSTTSPSAVVGQNQTNGATIFKRCAMCHTVDPAKPSGVGPNLSGVVGRKAGTVPKYIYSKALTASGITWSSANLDKYLARPQGLIPGNKMGFAGLSNPKDREDVIAYLAASKK